MYCLASLQFSSFSTSRPFVLHLRHTRTVAGQIAGGLENAAAVEAVTWPDAKQLLQQLKPLSLKPLPYSILYYSTVLRSLGFRVLELSTQKDTLLSSFQLS